MIIKSSSSISSWLFSYTRIRLGKSKLAGNREKCVVRNLYGLWYRGFVLCIQNINPLNKNGNYTWREKKSVIKYVPSLDFMAWVAPHHPPPSSMMNIQYACGGIIPDPGTPSYPHSVTEYPTPAPSPPPDPSWWSNPSRPTSDNWLFVWKTV